ncbi:MAG: hypothetical protein GX880_10475 [Methanomicrobiales archaeon]|nr:hypothetical protein [Methanomicrobiales archaeon]
MASHHFLDANILIGSLTEWDGQHSRAHRYMQQEGFRRHTSERVYRECTGVLGRFRRTILQYLKYLEQNLPAYPDPLALDQTIDRLTERRMRALSSNREQSVLRSFVRGNMEDLRNAALGTEEERRAFRRDVIDAIKGALKSLDGDCRDDPSARVFCYTCCPDDYDVHFPEQKSSLIDALQYEPDTLVVLDSYFLLVHRIREEVCFVTADNAHILRNHDRIEEILPGIIVRGPDSFLAGEGG